MRTGPGEDVSCRNLYKPAHPRLTSVPEELAKERRFAFESSLPGAENPWELLEEDREDGAIPVVADYETARWILKKRLGDRLRTIDEKGRERDLRIVGLLRKGIFQGELLASERNLRELFPSRSGYGKVLVEAAPEDAERVRKALAGRLSDFGVTVESTEERMASFTRIADSYISAFEALGGLGVLFGSFGLVVVLVRGVIERRAEIALMAALGFRPGRVAALVSIENVILLILGISAGTASALLAVSPEFTRSGGEIGAVGLTLALFGGTVAGVSALLAWVSSRLVRRVSAASLRLE
jgi:hypothetical protein